MTFDRLPSLRLAARLPLTMALVALAAAGALGLLSLDRARAALWVELETTLDTIAAAQAGAMTQMLEEQRSGLALLGLDPALTGALQSHNRGLGSVAGTTPGPEADDHAAVPERVQAVYRRLSTVRGYGDLYLFAADGDLVYSVSDQTEPGANVFEGLHAGSLLADAVRDALSSSRGEVTLTDFGPFDPLGDVAAAFMATPVLSEGEEVLGVVAVRLTADGVRSGFRRDLGTGRSLEVYLAGQGRLLRSAADATGAPADLGPLPDLPHLDVAAAPQARFFPNTIGLDGSPAIAAIRPIEIGGLDWSIVVETDRREALAPLSALRREVAACLALALLLGASLGWWTSRGVTRPLARLAASTLALVDKRYDLAIEGEGRADEFGLLAAALIRVRAELELAHLQATELEAAKAEQDRVVSELGAALSRLAEGDLTRTVDSHFGAGYEGLRADVNSTMGTLNALLGSVVENAARIGQKSQEISTSSDDLSRRTESQAATLEQTAAALDQLTASVKSSALGAAEVDEVVDKARGEAEQSGAVVRAAVAAMSEIERSSDEIGQIIGVIDDIAFQTNLLALNAGVEAARAGDAGKGFAVVASEVRTLAQRSSDAAKQIKGLIGGSAHHVRQGVDLVGRAGEALNSIVGRVAHISELVSDIATGAREQATGLSEINTGVNQLDQVTQQNAAMVEQSTAASHALNQEAKELAEVVRRFRLRGPAHQPDTSLADSPLQSSGGRAVPWRGPSPRHDRLEATTGQPVLDPAWDDF